MALLADPVLRLTLFFRDAGEAVAWRFVSFPTASFAYAVQFAKDVAGLYNDVSNCAIWKLHIMYSVEEEYIPTARQGTVIGQLTNAGVFVFRTENDNLYSFSVPGISESKLVTLPDPLAGIAINQSDVDISSIVSAMVNGLSGVRPVAPWSDGDTNEMNWAGEFLEELENAYKGHEEA